MKKQTREYWLQAGLPPFEEFADLLSFQLDKLAGRVHNNISSVLAAYAINPSQYSILLALREQAGSSQITLGEQLGIDRASMVRFVDGLEEHGYAQRQVGADRRERIVSITPTGRKIADEIAPKIKQCEKDALSILNEEEDSRFRETVLKLVTVDPSIA